ncbi:hypothetical protein [Rhizorhabdus dicambivorans]|uniref:DUF11 domain-containing protein n=1 Tax=Rhizorhabdus dicambivorans TaxID=1850238 RepID=A0A2A4FQS2_9SPHN|nr:hypothetical protein [Rhizorhabdus dicambivorans]PCE40753.1 hypothetical protein COO09_18730 [Rhizorhabdus dicambivorans]
MISNVARIDYRLDGGVFALPSNRVEFRIGEIIEFTVAPAPVCSVANADGYIAVAFDVTNIGNGMEAFAPGAPLAGGGADFASSGVYFDGNGNGCYDAGIDPAIAPGGRTPPVAPGGSVRLFVVGSGQGSGHVVLPITSGTGTGGAGTAIVGAGDGGSDAVIGPSGGVVVDVAAPLPGSLVASLAKTQRVSAPDGSAQPRRGAIVTYAIEGRFTGSGVASAAVIADAIPTGTTYVPGSLFLDGARLSDAAGDDAGRFDGHRVAVSLGDVAAPAMRSISFQVRIN